jgi:hypothetical protein
MSFTVDDVRAAAGRMVNHLEKQTGSKMQALKMAARRCGLQDRALRRFVDGTVQMKGLKTAINIRSAYRQTLIDKIAEHQAELRRLDLEDEIADGEWSFDLQIAALQEKLKAIKERLAA